MILDPSKVTKDYIQQQIDATGLPASHLVMLVGRRTSNEFLGFSHDDIESDGEPQAVERRGQFPPGVCFRVLGVDTMILDPQQRQGEPDADINRGVFLALLRKLPSEESL